MARAARSVLGVAGMAARQAAPSPPSPPATEMLGEAGLLAPLAVLWPMPDVLHPGKLNNGQPSSSFRRTPHHLLQMMR